MSYTTVYLQYSETRNEDAEYEDLEESSLDEDMEDYNYEDYEGRCYVEFSPIKLSIKQPRENSVEIEIELDFEVNVGDILYVVIVRYNNHRNGVLEDWCVERVFRSGDEAEELVESLEDGFANAECPENKNEESIVVKAEIFSMELQD
jgi:hypothetical protein